MNIDIKIFNEEESWQHQLQCSEKSNHYICLVQKLANHRNISTTQHYFNYNQQMLANAVENVRV